MKTTVTIEILEAGQPHPFADTRYRARIKVERSNFRGKIIPKSLTEDQVKQLTRMFVRNFKDKPEWHERRLQSIRMIETGLWEVLLISPYTG